MKFLFFIVLLLPLNLTVQAQDDKGIKFERGLSWAQVKEKARKENKYIFLDAFTTWCAPCKAMAKNIFPQDSVGQFFNKNFINVAAQFNITKNDNKDVKNWYKDVAIIQKAYKISTYPTYLFFNPQGELVHAIYEASPSAEVFITKSKEALNPKTQFANLKRLYASGNRQPGFLLELMKSAITNKDRAIISAAAPAYCGSQADLLTAKNLAILSSITTKSSDPGFDVFRNHAIKADLIIGKGRSAEIARSIILDEVLLPALRKNGLKTDYGAGMVLYSGELNKIVNWQKLSETLHSKYPERAEEMMLFAKTTHADWGEDWPALALNVTEYLQRFPDQLSNSRLNSYAGTLLAKSDDERLLNLALEWSGRSLAGADRNDKIMGLYTCSNLLYKTGKKDEALQLVDQALDLTGRSNEAFSKLQEQMKKGEKTW